MDDKHGTNEICDECETERRVQGALAIVRSLAAIGIDALLDEATGAQHSRADGELARRFAAAMDLHEPECR